MIDLPMDFNALKISLASPEQIRLWSYGEVTKSDTINYRTTRPEDDGLFCEKIFGPAKDWECACGKYKKIKYRGITCDNCGVEVTRAKVRRERMGHIELAAPVAHIWFSKGTPNRLALILNLNPKDLENALYYSRYLITSVNENNRADAVNARHNRLDDLIQKIDIANIAVEAVKRLKTPIDRYMSDLAAALSYDEKTESEIQSLRTSVTNDPAYVDYAALNKTLANLIEESPPQSIPPLQPEIAGILECLESVQKNAGAYYSAAPALRTALYADPDEDPQLPPNCASWQAVGKKYDKLLKDFGKCLSDAAAALTAAAKLPELDDRDHSFQPAAAQAATLISEFIAIQAEIKALEDLRLGGALNEREYQQIREFEDKAFTAESGAQAALELIKQGDMNAVHDAQTRQERQERCKAQCFDGGRFCVRHCKHRRDECEKPCHERKDFCDSVHCIREELKTAPEQRQKKVADRLRLIEAFLKSGNKPEWMIITAQPVLPPELRPMIPMDGGRFASHDLNDLYAKAINRNNRLKRLIAADAPELILRNEKRMLQEAVDALIDNGKRGREVSGKNGQRLKPLAGLLRGKQGRFRQNLLGKRVDYSGRSVIVAGPELKYHQCGLPRKMALELFKPFVMNRLILNGIASPKSAKTAVEKAGPEIWNILADVVRDRPVLLNRAPTLHRLGVQAFYPVLIEGSAIRLHPLVTPSFNADFDGDQMAVHLPLSRDAVIEAKQIMLSVNNMIAPSSGEPIAAPTLDMVLGCFYLTQAIKDARGESKRFADIADARLAYDMGTIDLRALVSVRKDGQWIKTTPGRIIFNEALNDKMPFYNKVIDKGALKEITAQAHALLSIDAAAETLDNIKELGFGYASIGGITIAIHDVETPAEKPAIIAAAEEKINALENMYINGMLTKEERYQNIISIWSKASDDLTEAVDRNLKAFGGKQGDGAEETPVNNSGIGLYMMASSGAKGNISQIKQMAGMRGLMADPKGNTIERPIRSSFREGLSVMEYFISTHGARKGLTDTALRTADSGYLTRRLVDIAHNLIILENDCGTPNGVRIENKPPNSDLPKFEDKAASRYTAQPAANPKTGEIVIERNRLIDKQALARIKKANIPEIIARSPLTCEAQQGLCQMCYGLSLATSKPVIIGEAVGIIAAQSIGEPGTQLTMRTFHTGGIAGSDITSGLPRVQEIFEARAPKGEALMAEIDGEVEIVHTTEGDAIYITAFKTDHITYPIPPDAQIKVQNGQIVKTADTLATIPQNENGYKDVITQVSGEVSVNEDETELTIIWLEEDQRCYQVPAAATITVADGERVTVGQPLTLGPKRPQSILDLEGIDAARQYLIDEVQKVYRSQGVDIHDKHLETIICQMFRKVKIEDPGDSNYLSGDQIDRAKFERQAARLTESGRTPPSAKPVLLGLTKAALSVDSFLSAASFQETTQIIADAAIHGDKDFLRGLKENVIVGKLTPARLDLTPEGRKRLDIPEAEAAGPLSILTGQPIDEDELKEAAAAWFGQTDD